jgi:hypothetical protein
MPKDMTASEILMRQGAANSVARQTQEAEEAKKRKAKRELERQLQGAANSVARQTQEYNTKKNKNN